MNRRHIAAACAFALASFLGSAQAAVLPTDGSWAEFVVSDLESNTLGLEWIVGGGDGSALSFDFSIASGFVGKLTVVDTGFSGDRFRVTDNGGLLGFTGPSVDGDSINGDPVFSPSVALADPNFSRGVWTLVAGSHSVTGSLSTSLVNINGPLNSTSGAVRLEVSPVPEPATVLSMLAGLGLIGAALRRRATSN